MANKKYLPGWNERRKKFFWENDPSLFSRFMIGKETIFLKNIYKYESDSYH